MALVLMASLGALAGAPLGSRSVSFWYYPGAYGGSDINATLAMLAEHKGVTTSVMLGCGHNIDAQAGTIAPDPMQAALCAETAAGLLALDIKVELVLHGKGIVNDRTWFKNATANAQELVALGKPYKASGWNLDLEPPKDSTAADAQLYAAFCKVAQPILNAGSMRLTLAVATWDPMIKNNSLLAPVVDRLLDMETYNADSMAGWLNGDGFGGYYNKLVNPSVPRDKVGPGLGCWPAKCGNHSCWTTTAASGAERMTRMIADNVPEVALFRIIQVPKRPDLQWPEDWWWPLLAKFSSSTLTPSSGTLTVDEDLERQQQRSEAQPPTTASAVSGSMRWE